MERNVERMGDEMEWSTKQRTFILFSTRNLFTKKIHIYNKKAVSCHSNWCTALNLEVPPRQANTKLFVMFFELHFGFVSASDTWRIYIASSGCLKEIIKCYKNIRSFVKNNKAIRKFYVLWNTIEKVGSSFDVNYVTFPPRYV